MESSTVAIVNNRGYKDPGLVARILDSEGLAWRIVAREDIAVEQPGLDEFAMVISLGSWSRVDFNDPEVAAESLFLQRAERAGIAAVGVCFGAQLMAVARGASLFPLNPPRLGYFNAGELGGFLFFNEDGFVTPEGVEVLAADDTSCFAFRSEHALALQFHIDATADILARWTADSIGAKKLERSEVSRTQLLDDARATEGDVEKDARKLLAPFLTMAKTRAARSTGGPLDS